MPIGLSARLAAANAILPFVLALPAQAQTPPAAPTASESPLDEPGFQHFYNLEYDKALECFVQKAAQLKYDASAQNHIAQTILYQAMFDHGALESDLISATNPLVNRPKLPVTVDQQRRFDTAIQNAMTYAHWRLEANAKDAEALYAKGVAYGLRANWNYLVNKAWLDPLRDATQARKLHMQATEIDPNFQDARLVQGVHDYLVGSLPFTIKMLGVLAGFRGDTEAGIRTLKLVYQKGRINRIDAAVLLSAILRREKRSAQGVPMLLEAVTRFPRNYLFRFELALLYADVGDQSKAFEQVDEISEMRAKSPQAFRSLSAERVDYMRGNVYFVLRNYDAAIENLRKATASQPHSPAETNALAQAWLRLGQALDAKGKRTEAMAAYRRAMQTGPETASAKEAKDYLSSPFKHRHA